MFCFLLLTDAVAVSLLDDSRSPSVFVALYRHLSISRSQPGQLSLLTSVDRLWYSRICAEKRIKFQATVSGMGNEYQSKCGDTLQLRSKGLKAIGTKVGLGPGDIALDGNPAPLPPKKGHSSQLSAHVHCGQMAGWIKMALGTEVGLSLGHIVLDGDPAPLQKRGTASPPIFGPCLLWPNGCPSQLVLNTCFMYRSVVLVIPFSGPEELSIFFIQLLILWP